MEITSRYIRGAATALILGLTATTSLSAQNRIVLPQGSVILVRTTTTLESSTARVGQTFETIVDDTLTIDNYTVIPEGSRIRGVVRTVQAATRQQSGIIEVDFDRLTLSDGTSYPIAGRLTSTDSAERRQIESRADQRVVLVGGRGGIGGAIAGAGSSSSSTSSILAALGGLLSEGRDVRVPVNTPLAVQLEQRLVLRGRGARRVGDASTIYTGTDMIQAAQRALAQQNYYRGAIDGQLTYATQRALFEYQLDRGMTATGNLDGRTAQALGLTTTGVGGGLGLSSALSLADASALRRNSQALIGRTRLEFGVSTVGRLEPRRTYTESEMMLLFALSAFTDNASLYEQVVRNASNSEGIMLAGRALVDAARRVDSAMLSARVSGTAQSAWNSLRSQISGLDATYLR